MTDHLRFGIFLPPYHRTDQNPSLAIHRDLELVELWDRPPAAVVRLIPDRGYSPVSSQRSAAA